MQQVLANHMAMVSALQRPAQPGRAFAARAHHQRLRPSAAAAAAAGGGEQQRWVKVCGVTCPEDADLAAAAGERGRQREGSAARRTGRLPQHAFTCL